MSYENVINVIKVLKQKDSTITDVADRVGMVYGGAYKIVKALEEGGLVEIAGLHVRKGRSAGLHPTIYRWVK